MNSAEKNPVCSAGPPEKLVCLPRTKSGADVLYWYKKGGNPAQHDETHWVKASQYDVTKQSRLASNDEKHRPGTEKNVVL